MSIVSQIFLEYLPRRKKTTPSGWISFNAPCCVYNGHRTDNRGRGGYMNNENGGISYHCFNCGYKCSWQPGRGLSFKIKKMLGWLGVPDNVIIKLSLDVMKQYDGTVQNKIISTIPKFVETELPLDSKLLTKTNYKQTSAIQDYIQSRGLDISINRLFWSSEVLFKDRVVIPFYFMDKIVGYTARSVTNNKVKYLTNSQPGFVFGIDDQPTDRDIMIVCEGPIDAMLINAVSVLGSEISQQQSLLLSSCKKKIIIIPDRDKAGSKLVDIALDNNWSVSFPNWDKNICDVGEAVAKYGRALTLYSILKTTQDSTLKIKLGAKKWFGKNI